jgi:hypothetical protein
MGDELDLPRAPENTRADVTDVSSKSRSRSLRCADCRRAGTGAAAGKPAVATAPRHRNWGLLQLQNDIIGELHQSREAPERIGQQAPNEAFICSDRRSGVNRETEQSENLGSLALNYTGTSSPDIADQRSSSPNSEIARCFLRFANLDNGAYDRTNRYETALWRQVGQTLLTLDFL